MTTPMDDTLTAIGRQLSITYLPTVRTDSVGSLGGSLAMQGPQEWSKQQQARWRPAHPLTLNQRANMMKAAQAPVPSMMLGGEQPVPPRPRGASQ